MKENCPLTNEDGYTVIIALAILTLLTVIGISVTTTSTIDIMISGNEKTYTRNLYLAEAVAMQCAQEMEDAPNLLTIPYLNNDDATTSDDDIRNRNFASSQTSVVSSGSGYAAIYKGIVGSLKMGQPNIYAYSIYGWSNVNNGLVIVELGYRRAF